jgi:hypothetical protein
LELDSDTPLKDKVLRKFVMPPQFGTFKQAQRVQQVEAEQPELGFG